MAEIDKTSTAVWAVVLALVLISAVGTAGAQPDCSTVTYDEDADGDRLIEDVDQLQCIAEDPVGDYRLNGDIDAEETFEWNNGTGFEPIGVTFRGTLDGDGYTVTDLYIDRGGESEVGLFASTSGGAVVESIVLEDASVMGQDAVGGIVGHNEGEVRDARVTGNVTGVGDTSTGGVVGRNVGGVVTRAASSADVVGYRYVGGVVGRNTGEVSLSYADGTVRGDDTLAGVVGYNLGTVRDSYSRVDAEGRVTVAGVVGRNRGRAVIRNTYAAGSHNGATEVRGLVAANSATVEGSYYDESSVSQAPDPRSDPGGTELTTDDMVGERARQTMTELDFDETWETVTNPNDYPVLAWQTEEMPVLNGDDDGEDGDGSETDDGSEDGDSTDGDEGVGDGVDDGGENGMSGDGTEGTDNGTDDTENGADGGENETDDETDGGEGMPGFGVFVAVVALVAVGLSRRLDA